MRAKVPTPAQIADVAQMVATGISRETIATNLGVTRQTLTNWMRYASEGDERYLPFARAVHKAEAELEERLLGVVVGAGQRDWKAAAWFLERRFPLRWSPERMQPEADDAGGADVQAQNVYAKLGKWSEHTATTAPAGDDDD